MANVCSISYVWTKDGLRLPGVHYEPNGQKNVCVIFVHGTAGSILENYFADALGRTLAANNIGFVYSHNRGYSRVNDAVTSTVANTGEYKTARIGVTYERFADCLADIDAWIEEADRHGYKSVVLMGHSMGGPKVIYYYCNRHPKSVSGVILASPADMVGLCKKYEPAYEELLIEAKANLANGKPLEILSRFQMPPTITIVMKISWRRLCSIGFKMCEAVALPEMVIYQA